MPHRFATIFAAKDKHTRMVFADVAHQKGADPYAVKVLVEHILFLGHAEIRLRSDGENPIKALLNLVAIEIKKRGCEGRSGPHPERGLPGRRSPGVSR